MMVNRKRVAAYPRRSVVPKKKLKGTKYERVKTSNYSAPIRYAPMERTRKVQFIYSETFTLNAGIGTSTQYLFSANGCYDPNTTGTGTQPRGFDQLMALYDHGTCIGSKIDVGFYNPNATAQIVAVSVRDTVVTVANFKDMLEQPSCVWSMLPANDGGGVCNLTMAVNPTKFLGRASPLSDDALQFSASNNPAEECYYVIATGDAPGGDPAAIVVSVRITYTCILHEPKFPGAS